MTPSRKTVSTSPQAVVNTGIDATADLVRVRHEGSVDSDVNLIRAARSSEVAREAVYELARSGYHLYRFDGGESRFVRDQYIPDFWHQVKEGTFRHGPEGLVHQVEEVRAGTAPNGLVVVFSSMSNPYDKASLTRFFEPNYKSLSQYVGDSSVVLRIADIDGVVGGFYLNTRRHRARTARVAQLIRRVSLERGIDSDRIVLYGASKGGTAAFFYGLTENWRAVAVDPVVNDAYYESRYRDSHWTTGGLFVASKERVFEDAARDFASHFGEDSKPIVVVSSPNSPQFPYILDVVDLLPPDAIAFVRSHHPDIHDHPDVSRQTLHLASALITTQVTGMPVRGGSYDVDRAQSSSVVPE